MNLELLDPGQVPDRVDSTLNLPASLHFQSQYHLPEPSKGIAIAQEWKAAYMCSWNRRGEYLVAGYGSAAIAVHHFRSRTLAALYRSEEDPKNHGAGITSVSWSHRSRTLLAGAAGDKIIQLIDTTHPHGPTEAISEVQEQKAANEANGAATQELIGIRKSHPLALTSPYVFKDEEEVDEFVTSKRKIKAIEVQEGTKAEITKAPETTNKSPRKRYAIVSISLPDSIGASLQAHPRVPTAGLAVLMDGRLVLFYVPDSCWTSLDEAFDSPNALFVVIPTKKSVTCAAFCSHGDRIFAAEGDGWLEGFSINPVMDAMQKNEAIPAIAADCSISCGVSVWHLLVSRNNMYVVLNASDGTIRLYSIAEVWEGVSKPKHVLRDVVSKVKFVSCDISGDGEFVVGGANGGDNKYQLYLWNTSTGTLTDKLTGPPVQLFAVAWHPTRPILAVATSDGLVDLWGPRVNWTAFAPDFQSLPMNVEYVEREDEFDVDENGTYINEKLQAGSGADNEEEDVDVLTVTKVPVFDSDSEDESEVFHFEPKVRMYKIRGKYGLLDEY